MTKIDSTFKKELYIVSLLNFIIILYFSFSYQNFIESYAVIFSKFYNVITSFSHFFIIAFLPLPISLLIYYITKSKLISKITLAFISTLIIILLKIDTIIFEQFRYHLSPIVFEMVFGKNAGDIFQFSWANIRMAFFFVVFIISIQFLFFYLAKKITIRIKKLFVVPTFTLLIISLIISHFSFAWADVNFYRPITQFKTVFPVFYPLTAEDLMTKMGMVNEEYVSRKNLFKPNTNNNSIYYPQKELKTNSFSIKKNILFLVIDSWRADYLTEDITPNIYNFSKKSQLFNNHYSGSNMTTGGIFSLFYGIPATYFESFTGVEKSPVFINQLQLKQYDMKIYGSSTFENPPFNRNVFSSIKNLRLNSKGNTPAERDLEITNEWLNNIEQENNENPFFGFLFFDAAHGFDYPTENFKPKFIPTDNDVDYLALNNEYNATKLINRYKNSLNFIDEQVGKILKQLESKQLLENTIVVITSDHGQEFNDNKKGYWQHGGNFSKVQTQVPFLIFDFSKTAATYTHLTTHYDITPTLLSEYLGILNNYEDFSVGKNLYTKKDENWFICGYNQKYAIINENEIINVYQSGVFETVDKKLNPISKKPDINLISKAMLQLSYFYQEPK